MLKQEYPWLDDSDDAALVAGHTGDRFEHLAARHAEGQLDTRFPHRPGKIAYQLPCHLKAQNMGAKSADVLRLTGAEVETIGHKTDPAKDGPGGPAVKGSSWDLVEARVLNGTYPPGYKPKRDSKVMPPDLATSIPDLAAFLR